jgi:hypothetical protein
MAARPKRRAASIKPSARHCDFVEASPSRDLRDEEDDIARKLSHNPVFITFINPAKDERNLLKMA